MARTRGRAVRRRQQAGEDVQSPGTPVARARSRAADDGWEAERGRRASVHRWLVRAAEQ